MGGNFGDSQLGINMLVGTRLSARTHLSRLIAAAVGVLALMLVTPQAAFAAVNQTPDATANVQGIVYGAVHLSTGRTIVGGDFTGVGSHPTKNVGAFRADGLADKTFTVNTDGIVYAVAASQNQDVIYIGGTFTQVNGEPRSNLAAITPSGALLPWRADTNGAVRALENVGSTLFVGGSFNVLDGTQKGRLVALNPAGDLISTFAPRPDWTVRDLASSPASPDKLYVSGGFKNIGGAARTSAAEIFSATGKATTFNPNLNGDIGLAVDVTPDGSKMFYSVPNNEVYAFDLASGTRLWTTKGGGDTQAIESTDTEVFIGGHFRNITTWKVKRNLVASLNMSDGSPTAWNPHISGNMGPWLIQLSGNKLIVGGDFSHVGGQPRKGLARFSVTP